MPKLASAYSLRCAWPPICSLQQLKKTQTYVLPLAYQIALTATAEVFLFLFKQTVIQKMIELEYISYLSLVAYSSHSTRCSLMIDHFA